MITKVRAEDIAQLLINMSATDGNPESVITILTVWLKGWVNAGCKSDLLLLGDAVIELGIALKRSAIDGRQ